MKTLEGQILMAIWALEEKACGQEIGKLIKADFGKEPSIGSLYQSLEKLRDEGYITTRDDIVDVDKVGRKRVYFKLEGLGQEALSEFRRQWLSALSRLDQAGGAANATH
jgi:DNA-binding PadR family transcriptional regulator